MSAPRPAGHDDRSPPIDQPPGQQDGLPSRPGSEATGPQEPAVALEHLRSFTDGDPQLESELSALFLSSAGHYLARMAEALQTGASWQQTAHALKGASANLGARRLAALALRAERSDPSEAQLQEISRALDEVRAHFDQRPTS
jgi:HPt (histidine-containing phosphotransfer) domain-containing protein